MFLYVLVNNVNGGLYIGSTKNIERRLKEHNLSNKHYTGRLKGVWRLLAMKEFAINEEARKEEIRLKKAKNKKYVEWYIKNRLV